MCRVQHTNKNSRTFGVSAGKRDQIEFFFKKNFLSKIDVDLIIWSRIFVISKKNFLLIWSLFPALTPYMRTPLKIGLFKKISEFGILFTYTLKSLMKKFFYYRKRSIKILWTMFEICLNET